VQPQQEREDPERPADAVPSPSEVHHEVTDVLPLVAPTYEPEPAKPAPPDPPPLRGAPTIWMRSLRYHTYHGRRQDEDAIYLAHEAEVENIEALKFAVRIPSPPVLHKP
jgi:hypothetical protein